MMSLDPLSGAIVLGLGVILGGALVAAGGLAAYWISARSRGEKRPLAGEEEPPDIDQDETA
jgi:hypothetical protein